MIMTIHNDGTLYSVQEISELKDMGAVSTDVMYGSASMNGINGPWDALNNTNASALAQMGDHVYAIAAKRFNLGLAESPVSYVIEDITKKISDAANDIMVS